MSFRLVSVPTLASSSRQITTPVYGLCRHLHLRSDCAPSPSSSSSSSSLGQIPALPFRRFQRSLRRRHASSSPVKGKARSEQPVEGATDLSHAHFIASASPTSDFNPAQKPTAGLDPTDSPHDPSPSSTSAPSFSSSFSYGGKDAQYKGKLSPTNSHLFKLILPLPSRSSSNASANASANTTSTSSTAPAAQPTAFLLHPSQPLSHLSRLIIGSLPVNYRESEITYLALTGQESDLDSHLRNAEEQERAASASADSDSDSERQEGGPYLTERRGDEGRWQEVSWSQSTDLSDFIKQSCLNEEFKIVITPPLSVDARDGGDGSEGGPREMVLQVVIPSFASRTEYVRKRLLALSKELERMTKAKKQIDYTAHKGAQKLAIAALGGGVLYWGTVIRYTFFTSAGWDLMEPVTWATGFAALLSSAAFLIYHNREVSYSSLLDLSISARQRKLYEQHGLDIERWTEMVAEAKTLRREITRIAADYDIEWTGELENLGNTSPAQHHRLSTAGSRSSPGDATDRGKGDVTQVTEEGKTIDIDKTIDEASELALQTEEKKNKEKAAQRKGEVMEVVSDERERAGRKDEGKSEVEGVKKAREVVRKAKEGT